jgi:cardiolipin synthase
MILHDRILTLPNLITFARLALVPAVAWAIAAHDFDFGFVVFVAAALSDGVDGFIARRFNQGSKLGAALDPVADKLMVLVAAFALAAQGLAPWWLAAGIAVRDAVIVGGAIAFFRLSRRVEVMPTRFGKLNTVLEFSALASAFAVGAAWLPHGLWLDACYALVFLSTVASGAQYVWIWGGKAAALSHATAPGKNDP